MKKIILIAWIIQLMTIHPLISTNAPVSTIATFTSTGTTAIVPITAINFINIGSCNLRLLYDPAIVTATAVTIGAGVGGSISTNLTVAGVISLGWYTYPGKTLPDNTIIFNISFTKVAGCTSAITFSDNGYSCIWYDGNWNPLNDIPTENYYINGSVSFSSSIAPVAYAVTGGGSYCQGGSGLPVGVASSECGATYTLYKNTIAQVPTVAGTGAPITFGNQLYGTYTVSGTNTKGTTQMTGSAVITENANPAAPTVTLTQPTCTVSTGTITVTAPTGTGMTYSIDGTTYTNTTGAFTLVVTGTYSVTAKNSDGCISPGTSVTINAQPPTPAAPTASATLQPTCTVSTGTITVTAPTGIGMTYSIDGTTYTNTTGIFTLVATGTYNVTAKNSDGCISPVTSVTINAQPPTPAAPTASATLQPTCTVSTGTITVTAPTGTGMTYSIDGTTYTNTTGVFTLVATGTYSVTAKNSDGCISQGTSVTINAQPPTPAAPTASATLQPTCTVSTGTITVTAPTGTGMTYSIDGTTYTNTTGIFTLVVTGTYSVTANNSDGCISPATSVTINAQPPIPAAPTATLIQPTCTVSTGTITITAPTGTGMTYSIDGTTYTNTTGIFTLVVTGTYSVTAKNSDGCISPGTSVTINVQPSIPSAPTVTVVDNCGTSTLTASAYTGTLLWSTNETTASITVPDAGTYTVTQTLNGCISPEGSGVAAPKTSYAFSGLLKYWNNDTPLGNVWVHLSDGQSVQTSSLTGNIGHFEFAHVCPGNFTITLSTTEPTGGINATDALNVNFWGTEYNSYEIELVTYFSGNVAPDPLDNMINSADAGRILQYFVTDGTPPFNTSNWKFWWAGETISANPYNGPDIMSVAIDDNISKDLYGLCTGDFNGGFVPGSKMKAMSHTLTLTNGTTRYVKAGSEFALPIYTGGDMEVGAVSLVMNFPSDKLEILGVIPAEQASTPLMYSVSGDELRIGWTSLKALSLKAADKLLTLKVKLVGPLGKDETIRFTLAENPLNELADGRGDVIGDALLTMDMLGGNFLGTDPVASNDALSFTSYPNPFNGMVTFECSLPLAGEVTIELRDMPGVLIRTIIDKAVQTSGDHKLTGNLQDLPPGVYMLTLKLDSGNQRMTRTIKIMRN